ncbi:MAG: DNA translocase FtsK 4TM domain-containing protein, partial [Rubrivivax sp.]
MRTGPRYTQRLCWKRVDQFGWRGVRQQFWSKRHGTRLYRFEDLLPGTAGGIVGYTLGPLSMRWLGFAGSG